MANHKKTASDWGVCVCVGNEVWSFCGFREERWEEGGVRFSAQNGVPFWWHFARIECCHPCVQYNRVNRVWVSKRGTNWGLDASLQKKIPIFHLLILIHLFSRFSNKDSKFKYRRIQHFSNLIYFRWFQMHPFMYHFYCTVIPQILNSLKVTQHLKNHGKSIVQHSDSPLPLLESYFHDHSNDVSTNWNLITFYILLTNSYKSVPSLLVFQIRWISGAKEFNLIQQIKKHVFSIFHCLRNLEARKKVKPRIDIFLLFHSSNKYNLAEKNESEKKKKKYQNAY